MHAHRNARGLITRLLSRAVLRSHSTNLGALQRPGDASGLWGQPLLICRSFAVSSTPTGDKAAGSIDSVVPAASAAGVGRENSKSPLRENGFWQAAEVLFSKREAPNLVGRWDWHAWQLFVALLPPLAIFGIAKYGQREMEEADEQQRKLEEDAAAAAARSAAAANAADAAAGATGASADARRAMAQRLDAVEATVRALQAHLDAQPSAVPLSYRIAGNVLPPVDAGTNAATDVRKAVQSAGDRVPSRAAGTGAAGSPSAADGDSSVRPSREAHSTESEQQGHS